MNREKQPNINQDLIFWNVDTQNDFMLPTGKLAVADAMSIAPNLEQLTRTAKENNLRVINTMDAHLGGDGELSSEPDFIRTYPEHCMKGTTGAAYISATQPDDPYVLERQAKELGGALNYRNIVIEKNEFNAFEGNSITDDVLQALNPEAVVVYGVATNVCVKEAVHGLLDRKKDVYVVTDAIKHLPHLDEMDHPLYQSNQGTLDTMLEGGAILVGINEIAPLVQSYRGKNK